MRALRRVLQRAAAAVLPPAPPPPPLHAAGTHAPLLPPPHAHVVGAARRRRGAAPPVGAAAAASRAAASSDAAHPSAPPPPPRLPPAHLAASATTLLHAPHRGFAGAAALACEEVPAAAPEPPPLPSDQVVTVKAFYIAQRIDLGALARQYVDYPVSQHRDSVIVSLTRDGDEAAAHAGALPPYVCVTGFGSVVFFGGAVEAQAAFLAAARRAAVKLLPSQFADELQLHVQPSLEAWSRLAADTLALRALDANNLRVVSSVLAQSVALSHFEAKVDAMLELFGALNREMEAVGTLPLPKRRLFQLVAENNIILTDVITKLGLLSRSDAAWAAARYTEVWDGLRLDFELDTRFENLHFKLELIATQLRFHMDVLQNKKSDALEWTIIILVAAECVLSLYEIINHM